MNILLIEDDEVLIDGLTDTLSSSGYRVASVTTAAKAKHLIQAQGFDLIILDLGLPDMDGLQLLRQLRRQKIALPIMILTARDDMKDRIEGISHGADDYMTKPFELKELEVRLQALLRRCYGGFSNTIEFGDLSLDINNHQIKIKGQSLSLSAREELILELMMLHVEDVISKDRIAQYLSSDGNVLADNTIEIYIHRIRKRLEAYNVVIRTFHGIGYQLEIKPDE